MAGAVRATQTPAVFAPITILALSGEVPPPRVVPIRGSVSTWFSSALPGPRERVHPNIPTTFSRTPGIQAIWGCPPGPLVYRRGAWSVPDLRTPHAPPGCGPGGWGFSRAGFWRCGADMAEVHIFKLTEGPSWPIRTQPFRRRTACALSGFWVSRGSELPRRNPDGLGSWRRIGWP